MTRLLFLPMAISLLALAGCSGGSGGGSTGPTSLERYEDRQAFLAEDVIYTPIENYPSGSVRYSGASVIEAGADASRFQYYGNATINVDYDDLSMDGTFSDFVGYADDDDRIVSLDGTLTMTTDGYDEPNGTFWGLLNGTLTGPGGREINLRDTDVYGDPVEPGGDMFDVGTIDATIDDDELGTIPFNFYALGQR